MITIAQAKGTSRTLKVIGLIGGGITAVILLPMLVKAVAGFLGMHLSVLNWLNLI